ncbi:MAG TPA: PilZ domain-containing protein [Gemmataceae bacterium]|jgi:hypothetical protein
MSTVTAPPKAAERRSAVRRQPTLGTVCRLEAADGKSAVGLVWNISTTGVSMLLNTRVDRGAALRGVLATTNDGFSLPVTLRVAHVAKLQTGDYLIGSQFDRALSADEMRHFVPESAIA